MATLNPINDWRITVSHSELYQPNGQPLAGVVGPECREPDGAYRIYDAEGYSVPIPDSAYYPDPEWPQPTPEEQEQGALILANAALQRALKAAREVVWSACADFDQGEHMPARTDHAIAVLDDALTSLETMSECPDPDPVLTHAMNRDVPKRLPWHVALANGLLKPRRPE